MKRIIIAVFLTVVSLSGFSQRLYDEKADWKKQFETAFEQAQKENKHVLVQFGGNWCKWCLMFNKFLTDDKELSALVDSNFVVLHLDYKKDEELLKATDWADRFGFPVLLIYESSGKRIHTQATDLLEQGEGYDKKKVMNALRNWTPAATEGKLRRR